MLKADKVTAFAMFAAVTLAIAVPVCAGSGKAAVRASSVSPAGTVGSPAGTVAAPASTVAGPAGVQQLAAARANNRRFFRPYSPYGYGYGGGYGYGNQVYLNPDEADWAEQWRSLRDENNGPYARSTYGNPQGEARMWEFPDDASAPKPSK
jgi:hypothetical protein